MSLNHLADDLDAIRQQENDNAKIFDLRMNVQKPQKCRNTPLGYLTEPGGVQNTNLESQMLGLARKTSKLKQENEWSTIDEDDNNSPLVTSSFANCDLGFNEVRDRSKFSENNLVSDIIMRRFDYHNPSIYQKLVAVRQTSIGMDTRQYTKDRWLKQSIKAKKAP